MWVLLERLVAMIAKTVKACGLGAKDWRTGWLAVLIILASLATVVLPPNAVAQEPVPHVLVLHSYHRGLSWTDGVMQGMQEVFAESDLDPEVYVEYMDTKRFAPDEEYYQGLYSLYWRKYRDAPLDLVLISDNNAFDFVLKYHETLFPGIPIVFCGINFFEDEMLAGVEDTFTGVVEDVDITDTLDLMLRVHPDTRQIVVVNDATTTGQVYQRLLREITPQYADRVEFRYYTNPVLDGMLRELGNVSEHTLILLVLLNRDRAGNFYTYEESIELIYENTRVPVYGLWDFYMGHGIVGGKLTNARSQGEAAAEKAVEILEGTPVSEVAVLKDSPNRYIFDYQQLERFGISVNRLPEDSEITNRPPTFYEQYRRIIWPVAGVITGLLAIVVVQLVNLRQRREVETDLRETNRALEATRATLEERVAQRTADLEKRGWQLEMAAEVVRDAAGFRDLNILLTATVERISRQFGYYHAGIFLVDESGAYAVLRAASSEGGRRMLERGHRLTREVGIVGSVLQTGRSRIALDVGEDAIWLNNPDLPETRSEMTLPLRVRGELVGVLDVQSTQPAAFDEEDITILETMADQLALAIDNVRLYQESQQALEELERVYGEQSRRVWEERMTTRPVAFQYTGVDVRPIPVDESTTLSSKKDARCLRADISLRGQVLASLELERQDGGSRWSDEERELVQSVVDQASLALENARLFEETRALAQHEQQVGEITDRLRAQLEIEAVLEQALRDLGQALGAERAVARLALVGDQEEAK
jgi:GAF domain-containing protein/ABC-type uncharacterized transport system substrate-binding protein